MAFIPIASVLTSMASSFHTFIVVLKWCGHLKVTPVHSNDDDGLLMQRSDMEKSVKQCLWRHDVLLASADPLLWGLKNQENREKFIKAELFRINGLLTQHFGWPPVWSWEVLPYFLAAHNFVCMCVRRLVTDTVKGLITLRKARLRPNE